MSAAPTAAGTYDDRPASAHEQRRFDGTWLVKWPEVGRLIAAYVCVVGVFALVGLMYTDWFAPNGVTRLDDRIADAVADNRTAFLNDASTWCAYLADTYNKIAISVLIFGFFLWRWRRWYEALYMALPLVFEASAFIVVTHIVERPRPDVERLIDSNVASSYPSGHVAAATVYFAVAIVILKHVRATWIRAVTVAVSVLVPLLVAWARVHQGMHFFTDVIAGIVLGVVWLVLTDRILARHEPDDLHERAAA